MRNVRPSIAITGMGAVSALGEGVHALRDGVLAGRDGLRPMQRLDLVPLAPIHLAGEVRAEPLDARAWAVMAAREACADAGIDPSTGRVGVIVGTTDGEGAITAIADAVQDALALRGPAITISTACSSSTNAIGLGCAMLERGEVDVVLAGGAERLLIEMFAGFAALGVLSTEKCAPFGDIVGTTLGEGAGFLVLEREGGREPHGYVLGHALSSDGFHETSPDPRGEGIARAIRACMSDAGLAPSDVDYVNAHATGTAANDDAEWRGIQKALGSRALQIPVNGSKGLLGHAQGACGVLEAITTLVCMKAAKLPPSVRIGKGRRQGPPHLALGPEAPEGSARIAIASNAAFGGANAVLALGLDPRVRPFGARRGVRIVGFGHAPSRHVVASSEHDLRQSDPAGRMMLCAAEAALADAGLKVRGAVRERIGIFAGASQVSPFTVRELRSSIEVHGLARASAPAFARAVLHAPTGAASRFLGLRGPATTLVAGGVAGVLALAEASALLAERDDADWMCAGAWDERDDDAAEGATCLLLGTGPGAGIAVLATAVARRPGEATALAVSRSGLEQAPRIVALSAEGAGAYLSLRDLAGVARSAHSEGRSVLLIAESERICVALILGEAAS
jgi:3-oxoacyl-[acyl-carrier-protein] synthase II